MKEQVRILKLENKKLQEERKAQLNVIERIPENQNSDIRKETGKNDIRNENSTLQQEQHLYSSLQVEDLSQQILVEENNSKILPEEKITTWIMSLGKDQIFAQQKGTFKHNSNCKNRK